MSDKQIQWIQWLILVVLIAILGFLGLQHPAVPPTPTNAQTFGAGNPLWTAPDSSTLEGKSGAKLQLDSGSLITVSASATEVHANNPSFSGVPSFGAASFTTITTTNLISQVVNFNASGIVTATAVVINSTPVFWATPIPTATPLSVGGVVTSTVVQAATVIVNSTPVFWATPQPTPTLFPFMLRGIGSSSVYTSGLAISTGDTVTETLCLIEGSGVPITGTYTITSTAFSGNFNLAGAYQWACWR